MNEAIHAYDAALALFFSKKYPGSATHDGMAFRKGGKAFYATAFKEADGCFTCDYKAGSFLAKAPDESGWVVNMSRFSREATVVTVKSLMDSVREAFSDGNSPMLLSSTPDGAVLKIPVEGNKMRLPGSPAFAAQLLANYPGAGLDWMLAESASVFRELPGLKTFVFPPEDKMTDWEKGFGDAASDFGFEVKNMEPKQVVKTQGVTVVWMRATERMDSSSMERRFEGIPLVKSLALPFPYLRSAGAQTVIVADGDRGSSGAEQELYWIGYKNFTFEMGPTAMDKADCSGEVVYPPWVCIDDAQAAAVLLRAAIVPAGKREIPETADRPSISKLSKAMKGSTLLLDTKNCGYIPGFAVVAKAAARLVKKWSPPVTLNPMVLEENWDELFLESVFQPVAALSVPRNALLVPLTDGGNNLFPPETISAETERCLGRFPLGKRIHVCGKKLLDDVREIHKPCSEAFEKTVLRLTHKDTGCRRPEDFFVHLHNHSCYSLLDGVSTPDAIAKRAYGLGQQAVALTDHGYLHGNYRFQKACDEWGVKPIHGVEAYFVDDHDKRAAAAERHMYHLTLLVTCKEGWKTLCRLMTTACRDRYYYKPRVDMKALAADNQGLLCLTACYKGPMAYHLSQSGYDPGLAKSNLMWLKGVFGDRLYNEAMKIGFPEYDDAVPAMVAMADECGVKTVATNDAHYPERSDADVQATLLKISTGGSLEMDSDELFMKSRAEMVGGAITEAMCDTTLEIASRVEFELKFEGNQFPAFDPATAQDYNLFLQETGRAG